MSSSPFLNIVTAIVFIGGGLWLLYFNIFMTLRFGHASKNWPTVKGHIELSMVNKSSSPRSGTTYAANIEYSYRVNEVYYRSKRIKFAPPFGTSFGKSSAERLAAQFPQASSVTIYYNPANPKISTLMRGLSVGPLIFSLLFSVLLIAGGVLAILPVLARAG